MRLTDRVWNKIEPIVLKYRDQLQTTEKFDTGSFEEDIKDGIGKKITVGFKTLVEDMLKREEAAHVAAHFMEKCYEHSNDYQVVLAKFYKTHPKEAFWQDFYAS